MTTPNPDNYIPVQAKDVREGDEARRKIYAPDGKWEIMNERSAYNVRNLADKFDHFDFRRKVSEPMSPFLTDKGLAQAKTTPCPHCGMTVVPQPDGTLAPMPLSNQQSEGGEPCATQDSKSAGAPSEVITKVAPVASKGSGESNPRLLPTPVAAKGLQTFLVDMDGQLESCVLASDANTEIERLREEVEALSVMHKAELRRANTSQTLMNEAFKERNELAIRAGTYTLPPQIEAELTMLRNQHAKLAKGEAP